MSKQDEATGRGPGRPGQRGNISDETFKQESLRQDRQRAHVEAVLGSLGVVLVSALLAALGVTFISTALQGHARSPVLLAIGLPALAFALGGAAWGVRDLQRLRRR